MSDRPSIKDRRIPEDVLLKLVDIESQRTMLAEMRIRLQNMIEELDNRDAALEVRARDINFDLYKSLKEAHPELNFEDLLVNFTESPCHWKIRGEPAPGEEDA